jgi:hypothetical protein
MLCGQRLDTQVPAKLFRRHGVVSGAGWCRRLNLKISKASAALTCLVGFDPRQIQPRLPAPWQARSAPAQAGAAGFPAVRARGDPLACGLAPFGNRTRRRSTGPSLSGPLAAQKMIRPTPAKGRQAQASRPYPDLTRVKSARKNQLASLPVSSALAEISRSGILPLVGRHQGVAAPEQEC